MSRHRSINSAKDALNKEKRTEEVTRILALILAFISVFIFVVKLLFL